MASPNKEYDSAMPSVLLLPAPQPERDCSLARIFGDWNKGQICGEYYLQNLSRLSIGCTLQDITSDIKAKAGDQEAMKLLDGHKILQEKNSNLFHPFYPQIPAKCPGFIGLAVAILIVPMMSDRV
jgi:hypothetical protein